MESKILADIKVPILRPKQEDCQNFREYIERMEKNYNFAKVFYINGSYFVFFLFIAESFFSIVYEPFNVGLRGLFFLPHMNVDKYLWIHFNWNITSNLKLHYFINVY